jgi:1,4-alpha-glucan branching enzyme
MVHAMPTISEHDVSRLLGGAHEDPFSVLGCHRDHEIPGFRVRVCRPDAVALEVAVLGADGAEISRHAANALGGAGVFEAAFEWHDAVAPAYRLMLTFPDGNRLETADPYTFPPLLGEQDAWLFAQGNHYELDRVLGSHVDEIAGVSGTRFAVWAPNARRVSVVGAFNGWDGRCHPMRKRLECGVWELFLPGIGREELYKFEVIQADGRLCLKSDPFARFGQHGPETASITWESTYQWKDSAWMEKRAKHDPYHKPMSIYECHLGSWARIPEEGDRMLTYRELAERLLDHVEKLGFTHIELMPITEYPFDGSWGYQVTGFFAPTSRHGSPDDFKYFVDEAHRRGIGIIVDWVPAHFPKDDHGLARFDGTALYEHADPRQGEHMDWGTYIFNFGRNEVKNFLISSALLWLREYHIDGLRVDAVASMLYLDYSRESGQWIPNQHGGRENLEAIAFLRHLNAITYQLNPGIMMIAEESTAWGGVSRPTESGGLGFGFKWNMGWMNDTLGYIEHEPVHRQYHHGEATFSMIYAYDENFILVLSHDEVVHGKQSLLNKMPGDRWQKFANLRLLYAWMWAHPGKKLLFQGGEIGQWDEWSEARSVDWHLQIGAEHAGVRDLLGELNRLYRSLPALHALDHEPGGFRWLDHGDAARSIFAFERSAPDGGSVTVLVNATPVPRPGYRAGVPSAGSWREILNTDKVAYGGSGLVNARPLAAEPEPWQGQPCSIVVDLPPLGVVWLKRD